jgi:hypothetical protein
MAPRTKKPHFVPAAYLQFWNFDGTAQGRESKVWWCDGKQCQLQRVGNMAVQADLYSPKNPNAAEAYFGEFEVDWAKLVGQLISGRPQRREILHRCIGARSDDSDVLVATLLWQGQGRVEAMDAHRTEDRNGPPND